MRKKAGSQKPEARIALKPSVFLLFFLLASGFWLLASLYGETLDKIVAVVEGHIITLSDVRQERSIRAMVGEKAIDGKELIQQLIESYLIETQLVSFPGIDVPEEEIAIEMERLNSKGDVDRNALHAAIRRRLRTARYFDVRFRQFLRSSDDDVRKYYEDIFVPEARTRGLNPIPPLEQVAEGVRKNVIEEQLDHEVMIWLEALRRRSNIEILN